MKIENKIIVSKYDYDIVDNDKIKLKNHQINSITDESIFLLKKLIIMLSPISKNITNLKVDATGSNQIDFVTTMSAIGGTIPTITSISQLGGCGIGTISGLTRSNILIIDSTPVNGGYNYTIGEVVTLISDATVIVTDIYEKNLLTIDISPISGGTGYVGGEIIVIGNGINGTVRVMSIDGSVLEISILESGYDYVIGSAYQISTNGIGTGLIVNVTSVLYGIGAAKSVELLANGINYSIGYYSQLYSNRNGIGLIVSVLNTDTGYGNSNFLQMDYSRWLYTDMIRNNINF